MGRGARVSRSRELVRAGRKTHKGCPALGDLLEDLALTVRLGEVDIEIEAVKVVDDLALHKVREAGKSAGALVDHRGRDTDLGAVRFAGNDLDRNAVRWRDGRDLGRLVLIICGLHHLAARWQVNPELKAHRHRSVLDEDGQLAVLNLVQARERAKSARARERTRLDERAHTTAGNHPL